MHIRVPVNGQGCCFWRALTKALLKGFEIRALNKYFRRRAETPVIVAVRTTVLDALSHMARLRTVFHVLNFHSTLSAVEIFFCVRLLKPMNRPITYDLRSEGAILPLHDGHI